MSSLDTIAQWLQREDDELLYTVDSEAAFNEGWMRHYILDGHIPVPAADGLTWGRWRETAERQVALTQVVEGIQVSTVFLGLDHQFTATGPPLLFETMVFRNGGGEDCERYSTWAEAEAGHHAMCTRVALVQHGSY